MNRTFEKNQSQKLRNLAIYCERHTDLEWEVTYRPVHSCSLAKSIECSCELICDLLERIEWNRENAEKDVFYVSRKETENSQRNWWKWNCVRNECEILPVKENLWNGIGFKWNGIVFKGNWIVLEGNWFGLLKWFYLCTGKEFQGREMPLTYFSGHRERFAGMRANGREMPIARPALCNCTR